MGIKDLSRRTNQTAISLQFKGINNRNKSTAGPIQIINSGQTQIEWAVGI